MPIQSRPGYQVPDCTPFRGGEGLVFQVGLVFFSTKRDNPDLVL